MTEPRKGRETNPLSPWRFANLGFEVALPIVLFVFVGYKVDVWLGSGPWLLLGGSLLGIVLGLYRVVKRVLNDLSGEGS